MPQPPAVNEYEFGRIVIDDQTYTNDVIILPNGVQSDWWRDEGHILKPRDLTAVLQAAPTILIIGQGAHGRMQVTEESLKALRDKGIEPLYMKTAQAVETYNKHRKHDNNIAAALHLTC
jgi:hypothetical protein